MNIRIPVTKGASSAGIAGLALFLAKVLAPLIPSPVPVPPEVLAGGLIAAITAARNIFKHWRK